MHLNLCKTSLKTYDIYYILPAYHLFLHLTPLLLPSLLSYRGGEFTLRYRLTIAALSLPDVYRTPLPPHSRPTLNPIGHL